VASWVAALPAAEQARKDGWAERIRVGRGERFRNFGKNSNKWNSNFESEFQQPKAMHQHECNN
jgi:hypothetical protein